MCVHVLAPSPTPALTLKYASTRSNKFQLGLQFVTKQNNSFLLGKATFGTRCIYIIRIEVAWIDGYIKNKHKKEPRHDTNCKTPIDHLRKVLQNS
jgi:hypothetical protein